MYASYFYFEDFIKKTVGSIGFSQNQATLQMEWFTNFNPFFANATFLYPLKTSQNLAVFWVYRKGAFWKNELIKFNGWIASLIFKKKREWSTNK